MIVDKILEHLTAQANSEPRTQRVGAHNAGRCPRQLWYQLHGYETEPMQARAYRVMERGKRIEQQILDELQAAHLPGFRAPAPYGDPVREKDVRYVPELDARVIADFFFDHEGREVPGEIKSMADFTFQRAEEGVLDEAYLVQAEVYCRAYDVPWVPVVCDRKETCHLHEVIVPRDDARWASVQANVGLARAAVVPNRPYALSEFCQGCNGSGRTPAKGQSHKACGGTGREPGGPFIPNFPCGYCAYKAACWGSLEQVFTDSGKPRWRLCAE